MQFVTTLTINANTPKNNLSSTSLKITDGVIHRIVIVFPNGCAGLAGVQILDGGHPIAPSTQEEYFAGDGRVIDFPEFYEITGAPRNLTVKGYNLDETYPHTITVEIYVLDKNIIAPMLALDRMVKAIVNVFARNKGETV